MIRGSFDQALANGRALLIEHPASALAQARAILNRDRNNAPALRLAAAALRRMGSSAEAAAQDARAVQASLQHPEIIAAMAELRASRPQGAVRLLHPIIAAEPEDAVALMLLAEAQSHLGELAIGETNVRRAIALSPSLLRAGLLLARLLMQQARHREGVNELNRILGHHPDNPAALRFKARLQGEMSDHAGAIVTYETLLEPFAADPGLWQSYGDLLRVVGRSAESAAAYRRGIALQPGRGALWWRLADLKASAIEAADIAAMQHALVNPSVNAENALQLHFALGLALDACGDPAAAFPHFAAGNRLKKSLTPHDTDAASADVAATIALFTPHFLATRIGHGDMTPGPVFIVGMPRSGSTLVEQILSRHPAIAGLGELMALQAVARTLAQADAAGGGGYRDTLATMPIGQLTMLGEHYRELAQLHGRAGKPFYIDKLPLNWRLTGLILTILPNARIIDVRRDAMDCCFSNYKMLFAKGHSASNDLIDMARYYCDYVALMAHFDAVAPGRIHRVIYEQLVDDLAGQTQALLEYVGVKFDPACAAFHENDRAVATASSEQVRRPLNRSGIGAWRAYSEWLAPLGEALGELAQA